MSAPRHFLDIHTVSAGDLRGILDRAIEIKQARRGRPKGTRDDKLLLEGRVLALVFDRPSTRTRVSFDMAMRQMGGETIYLSGAEMQLGRGESVADTARVLSRYVDAIMIRAKTHEMIAELAHYATVPVINGLTPASHPCQIMADVMTFEEHLGPIAGKVVAWSGDGNNVARSWIHGAAQFNYAMRLACPEELPPDAEAVRWARDNGADITLLREPAEAVAGAHCVVTDAWVSMHDDPGSDRHNLLAPYRVDQRLMERADDKAVFMHCLPAHREEEVTNQVMDGPNSVVFDEAENRLHAQKGILAWCLNAD